MDFSRSYDSVLISLRFALEPIDNILNSLSLLNETENLTGLNAWVIRTAASLTQQQREKNRLIFELLRDSLAPAQDVSDFPSYLKQLGERDPYQVAAEMQSHIDMYHGEYYPDFGLQTEIDALLNDAPATWRLIISHLEDLWETELAAEWGHVQPSLIWQVEMFTHGLPSEYKQTTVETILRHYLAFDNVWEIPEHPTEAEAQFVDRILTAARFEFLENAFQYFTGREFPGNLFASNSLDGIKEIIFVPSWHTGRHVLLSGQEKTSIKLFFSEPPNYDLAAQGSTPMGGGELRSRLHTLSDETHLRILELLIQHNEMHAQEIIEALELSQPSVSQHLKQLVSLGYLYERRGEGATKTYRLSSFYVARTARALKQSVSDEHGEAWTSPGDYHETLSEDLGRFLDRSGRLTMWPPARQRDTLLLLEYLASFFERGRLYNEKEVNELMLLHSTFSDPATLRRALYEYRFLNRNRDGSQYWL